MCTTISPDTRIVSQLSGVCGLSPFVRFAALRDGGGAAGVHAVDARMHIVTMGGED
jgi:hypothetical protein